MVRVNRRDLIASLGASAALIASKAQANCDVWRDNIGGVPTKSYQCQVGERQTVTTTFMRLSDVMFDSAGAAPLPREMGEYQSLVQGHSLVPTKTLDTFTRLFEKHSFAFEPENLELEYDLRAAGSFGRSDYNIEEIRSEIGPRWRTLGVWNDTVHVYGLPMFPLPDELRRAMDMSEDAPRVRNFLRFANPSDFSDLEAKINDYTALWDAHPEADRSSAQFGNIRMLAEIDAGSVPGFIPLFFSKFHVGGCSIEASGGATFMPPALYVDVAVIRNDGTRPVRIDDLFGAADQTEGLRLYDPATPPQEIRFNFEPITLAPAQSMMVVQRLLFRREPVSHGLDGEEIRQTRAVYGTALLPKGVIVDGVAHPFDGRSHNAVILASYANCCSCPYLESWCPRAGEWIEHGKVLQACDGPDKAGVDTRRFPDVRTRFRLSEREHEETFLTGSYLTLKFADEVDQVFPLRDPVCSLSIGESRELVFDVPDEIAARATTSALTVAGHYEVFTQARFQARAAALAS
ncbi:hypothetical protein [Thalassococcus lentus]|uniref:Uncharacterized protein n=1 Tax=Thalassococcus lentus TaxID=1210524 RepID=A0ABT4XTK4_9RHOB|nr:hypothetical protein [Thalassococcus lentus]MDA7425299.1 hypothetical protein [Thalassococcus lentus]